MCGLLFLPTRRLQLYASAGKTLEKNSISYTTRLRAVIYVQQLKAQLLLLAEQNTPLGNHFANYRTIITIADPQVITAAILISGEKNTRAH